MGVLLLSSFWLFFRSFRRGLYFLNMRLEHTRTKNTYFVCSSARFSTRGFPLACWVHAMENNPCLLEPTTACKAFLTVVLKPRSIGIHKTYVHMHI